MWVPFRLQHSGPALYFLAEEAWDVTEPFSGIVTLVGFRRLRSIYLVIWNFMDRILRQIMLMHQHMRTYLRGLPGPLQEKTCSFLCTQVEFRLSQGIRKGGSKIGHWLRSPSAVMQVQFCANVVKEGAKP